MLKIFITHYGILLKTFWVAIKLIFVCILICCCENPEKDIEYSKEKLIKFKNNDSLNTLNIAYKYSNLSTQQLLDSANYYIYTLGYDNVGCDVLKYAISQDITEAYAFLGGLILNEKRCEDNPEKGYTYLKESVRRDCILGIKNLSYYYVSTKKYDKAIELYEKGVALNSSACKFLLGYVKLNARFYSGSQEKFVSLMDREQGQELIFSAAKEGDAFAQFYSVNNFDIEDDLKFQFLISAYQKFSDDYNSSYALDTELILEEKFREKWNRYKREHTN